MKLSRRQSFITLAAAPFVIHNAGHPEKVQRESGEEGAFRRPGISLNLYSFNQLLGEGKLQLEDVIEYAYREGYDAVDPTAYYFRGYPEVPDDRYLLDFKRKVFEKGLEISGSGIRNDLSNADPAARSRDLELIRSWADACIRMGIPVLRIFAGHEVPDPQEWERTYSWMIEDFRRCAEIGQSKGIIMALQNHGEFIKTADEVIRIMKDVDSPWFRLHLDIANFANHDVYEEIEKVIPYAANWQVKEFVTVHGRQMTPDYVKIMQIIRDKGYAGYLPLETLGPGDPFQKLKDLKTKVMKAMDTVFG